MEKADGAGRSSGAAYKRKGRASKIALALTAVVVAVLIAGYGGGLGVTELTVRLDRLPKSFSGLRIAHLSDLHAAEFGEGNKDLFGAVRTLNPDFIAITGDIIQDKSELGYVEKTVKGLREIAPVFYVTGNHEWEARVVPGLREIFLRTEFLQNDYIKLDRGGDSVYVLGIEDPLGPRDMPSMEEVVSDMRRREGDPFIIMLSHRYDRFDEYVKLGADIVLSGHAHGGIVRLPFTDGLIGPGRVLFPKHTSGVTVENGTAMVTSRGLGDGEYQFRMFNPPELVLITLM